MIPSLRLTTALFVAVSAAALLPASSAVASNFMDASAGAACHAANPAATKFQYTNHYVTNLNATAQFLICDLDLHDVDGPNQPTYLSVDIQASDAGTVTCLAQTGYYSGGNVLINTSAARTYTFVFPGGSNQLIWNPGTLSRAQVYDVVTLNCKLDPNTRLGLIQFRQ